MYGLHRDNWILIISYLHDIEEIRIRQVCKNFLEISKIIQEEKRNGLVGRVRVHWFYPMARTGSLILWHDFLWHEFLPARTSIGDMVSLGVDMNLIISYLIEGQFWYTYWYINKFMKNYTLEGYIHMCAIGKLPDLFKVELSQDHQGKIGESFLIDKIIDKKDYRLLSILMFKSETQLIIIGKMFQRGRECITDFCDTYADEAKTFLRHSIKHGDIDLIKTLLTRYNMDIKSKEPSVNDCIVLFRSDFLEMIVGTSRTLAQDTLRRTCRFTNDHLREKDNTKYLENGEKYLLVYTNINHFETSIVNYARKH